MTKLSAWVTAAFLVVGAGSALADDPKPAPAPAKTGVSYPTRTSEINKHIAFVDLYLGQAMGNAKALATLGDAESGRMDAALVSEARRNLDSALDRALAHMKSVREYKSDLAMIAPGIDPAKTEPSTGSGAAQRAGSGDRLAKLDELETNLKEAKTAAKKLGGVKMEELNEAVDGVATHLVAAHQSFRDVAKWTSYTMLDDTNLGAAPVRGQEDKSDKGAGKGVTVPANGAGDANAPGGAESKPGTGSSAPGTMTPGGTPPADPTRTPGPGPISPTPTDSDKAKGKTIPGAKPEPVKPAPGGGY